MELEKIAKIWKIIISIIKREPDNWTLYQPKTKIEMEKESICESKMTGRKKARKKRERERLRVCERERVRAREREVKLGWERERGKEREIYRKSREKGQRIALEKGKARKINVKGE